MDHVSWTDMRISIVLHVCISEITKRFHLFFSKQQFKEIVWRLGIIRDIPWSSIQSNFINGIGSFESSISTRSILPIMPNHSTLPDYFQELIFSISLRLLRHFTANDSFFSIIGPFFKLNIIKFRCAFSVNLSQTSSSLSDFLGQKSPKSFLLNKNDIPIHAASAINQILQDKPFF
jgi:hypothetical protein